MLRVALLLPPLLLVAGCGRPADDGASVTLNAGDGAVSGVVGAGGESGALKIDLPGFKGELKLPKIKLDAENFELNGVHLYPGSTIERVDVGNGAGRGGDGVRLSFTSPAGADTVRDWFQGRLRAAGFTLTRDGDALVGHDKENKPFRMELTPAGDGRAKGTIALGD